jgi:predicted ester cyclase
MATPDENKNTYRRIIETVSRGDTDALDELVAPDVVDHNPIPDQAPGRQGFKQWVSVVRISFPDLHGTVEDVVAEGDRLAARVTWRGTQSGKFAGVEATDKPIAFEAYHLVRFSDEGAAEWWGTADLFGVLDQIGATVSGPEPAS